MQDSGELLGDGQEQQLPHFETSISPEFVPSGFAFVQLISSEGANLVYKARNQSLDQIVTIKVLRSVPGAPEQSDLSLQEARLLADLDHRSIVKLLQVGTLQDATPYLVYEYVEGQTLRSLLDKGPLDALRTEYLFEQLLDGLAYIHSSNLIHRDIKPENIIIDERDVLKILDFGIARQLDREGGTYQTLGADTAAKGTPLYMSPEQCERRALTTATDIYSSGCVLYECFAGFPPFQGESPMETIYKHTKESVPELPDLYAGKAFQVCVQQLIEQLLSKNVSERPDARLFAEKLRHAMSTRTANPITGKPSGEIKSQQVQMTLGVIAALVILVVLGTLAWLDHSQKTSKLINNYNLASAEATIKSRRLAATAPKSVPARIIRIAGDYATWQRNGPSFGENEFVHFKTELYSLLKVAKSLEDRYAIYIWLARIARDAGEFDDAIANYRAALALCAGRSGKKCLQASQCYLHIGENYTMKGKYRSALENILKAEALQREFDENEERFYLLDIPHTYRALENRGFMVRIQDELGSAYFLLHDYKKARKHLELARVLWDKPDEPIQFMEGKARLLETIYRVEGKDAALAFMRKWEADGLHYAETFQHVSYRFNNFYRIQQLMMYFCEQHADMKGYAQGLRRRMERTTRESEFDGSRMYLTDPSSPVLHR